MERHDQQVAHDHGAALLRPQSDLLTDDRVLEYQGAHLSRSVDRGVPREVVDADLAIGSRVVVGGHPGDHVRPAARNHRLQEQEFGVAGARLTGGLHLDVVGLEAQFLRAAGAAGA